jgi:predicted small secreted protein
MSSRVGHVAVVVVAAGGAVVTGCATMRGV